MDRFTKELLDGKKLKQPQELTKINYNREAVFVFKDGGVYYGWCDGEISADGYFYIDSNVSHSAHKLEYLEGWCYL